MPGRSLVARLRRRPRARPWRVAVVGRDAAVRDGLRAAGAEVVDAGEDVDLVVVLDPAAAPVKLPRRPLRLVLVARGTGAAWAGTAALEDADGVVVATDEDGAAVRPTAVLEPIVAGDAAGVLATAEQLAARPRLHVVTAVSNLRMRPRWGDHHYAVALGRALGRRGWLVRSWCQAELPEVDHDPARAVLLLAGGLELTPVAGRPTIAWVIYPRELDVDQLRTLHHVHVASAPLAAELAADGVPASALLQATDVSRFRPTPGGTPHQLLYVANSRNVRRRIPDDLLPTEHELAIYGYGWTADLVDTRHVVADHVANVDLPALYTAADVVLNDHWDAMREQGFLSNRLYDAAACGATVVTDAVDGLEAVFDGTVVAYRDPAALRRQLDALLADPGRRRELGTRARELVVAAHTFDHRADVLLASLPPGGNP